MKLLYIILLLSITLNLNAETVSETAAQRAITQAMKSDHLTTFRTNSLVQVATRRFNGKVIMILERLRIENGWSRWERTD